MSTCDNDQPVPCDEGCHFGDSDRTITCGKVYTDWPGGQKVDHVCLQVGAHTVHRCKSNHNFDDPAGMIGYVLDDNHQWVLEWID